MVRCGRSGSASSLNAEYPAAQLVNDSKGSNEELFDGSTASLSSQHKLTILTGMVFIVGEMAGSGILALPSAIENTGWIGLVFLAFSCGAAGWCGTLLGRCWVMLEERFPKYQKHCSEPYPCIGYETFGKPGKILVSVCVKLTLFGVSVVFMILSSENLSDVFRDVPALNFSACLWMLIVAAVLTPFVWLGTPKDFWPIAVGATVATGVACIIIIAAMFTDPVSHDPSKVPHNHIGIDCAAAFGTILFSFGGAAAFPTIQHDMRKTSDFPKSVALAFSLLLLMYLPVSAVGYFLFGNTLDDNVLKTLGNVEGRTWMYYTIQALICSHLLFAFTIVINPLCQEFEGLLRIPLRFTWKRAVFRTIFVLVVLFVGQSVPNFGPILSLIGGSTTTLLTMIIPCACYLKLTSMENLGWPERPASLMEKIFCAEMIILGIVGGVFSTYSSIAALVVSEFTVPCYVNFNQTF